MPAIVISKVVPLISFIMAGYEVVNLDFVSAKMKILELVSHSQIYGIKTNMVDFEMNYTSTIDF